MWPRKRRGERPKRKGAAFAAPYVYCLNSPCRSERKLQLHLQVARRVGGRQRPESRAAQVSVQPGEVCDVEGIKEVRLEPEVEPLPNREVLADRKIEALQARSLDIADRGVSEA